MKEIVSGDGRLASGYNIPANSVFSRNPVSAELDYCGHVPLDVTQEPATVRYLSECKWGPSAYDESISYYGRNVDITLICWDNGTILMGDE